MSYDEKRIGVFAGNGAEALVDGPRNQASFNQPSDLVSFDTAELYELEGLVFGEGKLYIADTNNHLIRVAHIANRRVENLNIKPF